MNENTELAALEQPTESVATPALKPGTATRGPLTWITGVGFGVLALAIFLVWKYPQIPGSVSDQARDVQMAQRQLAELESRLGRIEQRPPSVAPADIARLASRIDGLEGKVGDQTAVGSRLDALSGRIEALSGRDATGRDTVKQQFDGLSARVAALEKSAGGLDALSDRMNRIARIQEASVALALGRPTGDLPNAPAALARFAHSAPPTEGQLRLRFLSASDTALSAPQPDDKAAPFVDRVWERAQNLVTIRRGEDVIVGNSSSVALGRARAALDAGDLKSAVVAVQTLKGPPLQAMGSWIAQANELIAARSALADLADQS
jgi:hypothetical protein